MKPQFPKAKLFSVNITSGVFEFPFMQNRLANAYVVHIFGLRIQWRMPYHPRAAYQMGWDACFNQCVLTKETPDA